MPWIYANDYKNLIKVEKENLIEDLNFAKKYVEDGNLLALEEYFHSQKNVIHNILVYKVFIGESLTKDEYKWIIEAYYSEDYKTNTFDYFEVILNLDLEKQLPNLHNKYSNKDYLLKHLLKHLKNCIDSKNYTYDAITYFIDKYCSLIELYNKKYKSNFIITCEYKIQIFILKMYLKYRIRV